jgi:MoaA/NifB/PqqE/SkfB family radical SAM enzyme
MERIRLQLTKATAPAGPITLQILADAVCRRGCEFCSIAEAEPGSRNMSIEEIQDNLGFFDSEYGVKSVIFAGGEPTDRVDLLEILEMTSRQAGVADIVVVSRGDRWRTDEMFVRRVSELPVRLVYSLDLWTVADVDVRRDFSLISRGRQAIANASGHDIPVDTNSVISRQLIELGSPAIEALANLPSPSSTLTFPFPKGGALSSESEIVPSLLDTVEWLAATSRAFERTGRDWKLKGLPVCYVPQFRSHISRSKDRRYVSALHQFGQAERYFGDRLQLVHDHDCGSCAALSQCDGFWSHYLDGDDFPALSPIRQ